VLKITQMLAMEKHAARISPTSLPRHSGRRRRSQAVGKGLFKGMRSGSRRFSSLMLWAEARQVL
jgi:hypothetical protein